MRIPLPDLAERQRFLQSGWLDRDSRGARLGAEGNLTLDDLARRTSGLSLLRVEQLLATALRGGEKLTADLLSAGNHYGADVETGRFDASNGALLAGDGQGRFTFVPNRLTGLWASKEVRELAVINIGGKKAVLVVSNNDRMEVLWWR